jgi:hypothetical protein
LIVDVYGEEIGKMSANKVRLKGGNKMRIILAAVEALGISLVGASGVSAFAVNPAAIDSAAGADFRSIVQARGGAATFFGKYPSCKYLRSYNPTTRMFIGSDGKQHPCVPPR